MTDEAVQTCSDVRGACPLAASGPFFFLDLPSEETAITELPPTKKKPLWCWASFPQTFPSPPNYKQRPISERHHQPHAKHGIDSSSRAFSQSFYSLLCQSLIFKLTRIPLVPSIHSKCRNFAGVVARDPSLHATPIIFIISHRIP